jgi:hypothetical protein
MHASEQASDQAPQIFADPVDLGLGPERTWRIREKSRREAKQRPHPRKGWGL